MITVTQPEDIDIRRHAVIEASAGTGKTYTITHLVLRLLRDGLKINEVLLVTFTDKATSELKARLRQLLQQSVLDPRTAVHDRSLLQDALRDLSQASIHTIHGFCQRVLKECAFEQAAALEKSLVDDQTVLLQQLHALKRSWPAIEGIEIKLSKTGFPMRKLDELLQDLAQKMRPGDQLIPMDPEWRLATAKAIHQEFDLPDQQALEDSLRNLKGLSNGKKRFRIEHLNALLKETSQLIEKTLNTQMLAQHASEMKDRFDKLLNATELQEVMDANDAAADNLFLSTYHQLMPLVMACDAAYQADRFQFVIEQVQALRQRVKQHKVSQGQISYDDMIGDLALALSTEAGEAEQPLTARLRARYRVALIDEFQDTDPQQWSIFKHLFVPATADHRLVLIGDPKQAIYGFRGADIHTYEAAKKHLLSPAVGGQGYRLATNYRSLPELVTGLNQWFTFNSEEEPAWFQPDDVVVDSPSEEERVKNGGPVLLQDDSGLSAIHAITTDKLDLPVNGLRQALAEQMAQTMAQRLLGRVRFMRGQQEQTLTAGDICVLVRNKKEAKAVEAALDERSIPHAFYKKTDLYQSEAAVQIQLILTALAFPHLKQHLTNAWMGLFFDLSTQQLQRLQSHDTTAHNHPELKAFWSLWLTLKAQAAQRDWVALFHTLLAGSGTRERLYLQQEWRLLANLQQIIQELLKVALAQQADAHGLLHQLLQWRASKAITKEDWQQKDTEQSAVQIMTIHSSKGLEFPVVFLFGGFAADQRNTADYSKYPAEDRSGQVFDLVEKNHPKQQAESMAEQRRLYYVAMTRAVYKLVLPVYSENTYRPNGQSFYHHDVIKRSLASGLLSHDIRALPNQDVAEADTGSTPMPPPPLPPVPNDLAQRRRVIHSFSSLQRPAAEHTDELDNHFGQLLRHEGLQADDRASIAEDDIERPSIPGGAQTGNVLHGIFEHVDFALALQNNLTEFIKNHQVKAVIESQMKAFLMADGVLLDAQGAVHSAYSQEFAAWVWHTLNKPIAALDGLRLGELKPADRRHEMSFHWCHAGQFLTGFIDLLFKVDGPDGSEYYILDWKSNFSAQGYAPEVLSQTVMQAHKYHDQYKWYALAVKSWLAQMTQNPKARLAGALYVFSRGIDAAVDDQAGIFYQDLSTDSFGIKQLQQQLLAQINNGGSQT
ncbi:UvrD-helicase domain-containing protein [Marinicella meishanensis]|uniref:UvrD-helicase domain-containing protein n=1 Tax=Marinicella meishanensis TaxID=2873263 RepID=UPI001CC05C0D